MSLRLKAPTFKCITNSRVWINIIDSRDVLDKLKGSGPINDYPDG